ncbi:MAG TPA: polyphosphate kinase 2 family protein [Ignavibacteria bacterium]|nr:polyphosphate kinase 2 family protein [Ignavibacteria bacterium]HMR39434.1 polyphosphate kinase 2 family protein [Ignavibacteria bacterium]
MKNLFDYGKYCIKSGEEVNLKKFDTQYTGDKLDKEEGVKLLSMTREHLSELQDKLYAHNEYSILIVLQAMDTAGKDGAIKHIMSGLNPSGVNVTSFKTPSSNELEHDYFWRHYKALPARGEIGIFNRSHYENVLVTKVHPEFILNENLPGIDKISDINQKFWDNRYKQIKRFEKNLYQNGTIIFKFFLHLSFEEQKERLLERIDDPKKNWKFSTADVKERQFWDKYQSAYEEALSKTSTDNAPWFVIPADNKWFSRLAIAEILYSEFGKLNLHYPEVSPETKEELQRIKVELEKE